MGRLLKKPPIIETYCAFEVSENAVWDEATPGLILKEIEELGFKEREQHFGLEIGTETEKGKPVIQNLPRMFIYNNNKTRAVIIKKFGFSVNNINGFYDNWDGYFALIKNVASKTAKVIDNYKINTFIIGYENMFVLEPQEDFREFFNLRPHIHEKTEVKNIRSFVCALELRNETPEGELSLQLSNSPDEEIREVRLEIALESGEIGDKDPATVYNSIQEAHDIIEKQFFSIVKEELIKRYE